MCGRRTDRERLTAWIFAGYVNININWFVSILIEDSPELTDGATWSWRTEDWVVEATMIDGAARGAFIERVTGLTVDPFAASSERTERFVSFLLHVRNTGDGKLAFNPYYFWLKTNNGEHYRYPIALRLIK